MKQSWKIKKLGEVCEELFAGGDVPKNNSSKIKSNGFNIPIFSNGEKNKGLYGYTNVARVTKPSITISARGTIGYSEIREEAFYPAIRLIVVIPNTDILDLSFLKYVISGIDFTHSGSSIPQLTVPMIREYPIPIPPLPEQQRIVAFLDKAFEAVEKAKANAEQNLKNAKDLFDSFCNKELWEQNKNCPKKLLSDIVDISRGGIKIGPFGSALKIGELVDQGNVRVLYIENIVNNKFDWHKEKYITTDKFNELKNYEVFSGDVLITIMGTIGRTAIVPENLGKSIISSHLIKITPNKKIITSEFLNYSLNRNPFVVKQLFGQAKGAIMKGINSTIIKNLFIPLPSLKEQESTIQKLDALSVETKKLEIIYQKKIDDLEELKKSILQRAFCGELDTTKDIAV